MIANTHRPKTYGKYMLLLGIVLIAANLRAPITSVGPVIPAIQTALNLSNALTGLITTSPLLAFAAFSPIAARSANRWRIEAILWVALLAIGLGLFVRMLPHAIWLFLGASLIGCGIAFGNVLMPPLIKERFPDRIGFVTGIYSIAMSVTASLASGFSIAIGEWTGQGWQGSIGVWLVFSVIAITVWAPRALNGLHQVDSPGNAKAPARSLLRFRKAWYVTLFMGLQSFLFYCAVAWLPLVLQDWGMTAQGSGWMLSLIQLTQLPVMFIGPIVIGKLARHQACLWFIVVTLVLSMLLITVWKTDWIIAAVVLFGIGTGLAFSLSMMWFVLRTENTADAARLSGMAQSFGYLLAAAGPPLFGAIHDWAGNWETAFILLLAASVALFVIGMQVANPGAVNQQE